MDKPIKITTKSRSIHSKNGSLVEAVDFKPHIQQGQERNPHLQGKIKIVKFTDPETGRVHTRAENNLTHKPTGIRKGRNPIILRDDMGLGAPFKNMVTEMAETTSPEEVAHHFQMPVDWVHMCLAEKRERVRLHGTSGRNIAHLRP